MSEMMDRITKVIADSLADTPREIAAAILLEMREPTMEMESAASNWQGPQMTYSDVWRSMVDAASGKD